MIKSIDLKNTLIDENGEEYLDLSIPSFRYNTLGVKDIFTVTTQEMRIDLISYQYYATMGYIDALMNVNNITNPFSIKNGDSLIIPYVTDDNYKRPEIVKDLSNDDILKPTPRKEYNQKDEDRERRLKQLGNDNKSSLPLEQHKPNELTRNQVIKKYINGKIVLGTNLNTK